MDELFSHIDHLTAKLAAKEAEVEKLRDTIQWAYDLMAKNNNDGAFEKLGTALAATSRGEGQS